MILSKKLCVRFFLREIEKRNSVSCDEQSGNICAKAKDNKLGCKIQQNVAARAMGSVGDRHAEKYR